MKRKDYNFNGSKQTHFETKSNEKGKICVTVIQTKK